MFSINPKEIYSLTDESNIISGCLQKVNEYLLKAIKITFDGMTCIKTYFCFKRDIKTCNYVISDL